MAVWTTTSTPAGRAGLAATTYGICKLSVGTDSRAFERGLKADFPGRDWRRDPSAAVLERALDQLRAYFERRLKVFDLPLDLSGSSFQRTVWHAVREIPWGQARSYQQVGEMIGRPRAPRAVGGAMAVCQVSIFIPCHRVTAAGGRIGGWGKDIGRNKWLLDFEGIPYR